MLSRAWTSVDPPPSLYDIDGPEDLPRLEDHPVLGPTLAAVSDVSPFVITTLPGARPG